MSGRGSALVVYISETGTARDVSEEIYDLLCKMQFSTRMVSVESYDMANLIDEKLVVFVCSTAGQGQFPISARRAWLFLRRSRLPSDSLKDLNFAVFGLGDSSFMRFNFAAKLLFRRLVGLGANALVDLGMGDDQHRYGLYASFIPWLESLEAKLEVMYPWTVNMATDGAMAWCNAVQTFGRRDGGHDVVFEDSKSVLGVKVVANDRISHLEWNIDIRRIRLAVLSPMEMNQALCRPGDVLYIQPRNTNWSTMNFVKYMGYDLDAIVQGVKGARMALFSDISFPMIVGDLVSHLDFLGSPGRHFFARLAGIATSAEQREKLSFLSTLEGQEELHEYCKKSKRTYFDVLQDFDSCRPSVDQLVDLIPRVRPRPFSISSYDSGCNTLDITINVIKFKTPTMRIRSGVCSNWLASLNPPSEVIRSWISPGYIPLLDLLNGPMLLVGTGTGCAPFLAFFTHLHEKRHSMPIVDIRFYFGCRSERLDFIYRREWTKFVRDGILHQFSVAFSRDRRATKTLLDSSSSSIIVNEYKFNRSDLIKVHVQNLIEHDSEELISLLMHPQSSLCLCGNQKMPQDVRKLLVVLLAKKNLDGEPFLKNMESSNRYFVECW